MTEEKLNPDVRSRDGIHVELTHSNLNITSIINTVRSPKAGAIVLFAGIYRMHYNPYLSNDPKVRLVTISLANR